MTICFRYRGICSASNLLYGKTFPLFVLYFSLWFIKAVNDICFWHMNGSLNGMMYFFLSIFFHFLDYHRALGRAGLSPFPTSRVGSTISVRLSGYEAHGEPAAPLGGAGGRQGQDPAAPPGAVSTLGCRAAAHSGISDCSFDLSVFIYVSERSAL